VSDTTLKLVAATEPNTTLVAPVKLVPVIVTVVPPAAVPEVGEMPVTAGEAYVNSSPAAGALVPSTVLTKTLCVLGAPGGDTATISLSDTTANPAAGTDPKRTPVAEVKPEPSMVMIVPPAVVPTPGEIVVTTGGV
jgi:hypothetical protein